MCQNLLNAMKNAKQKLRLGCIELRHALTNLVTTHGSLFITAKHIRVIREGVEKWRRISGERDLGEVCEYLHESHQPWKPVSEEELEFLVKEYLDQLTEGED